MSYSNYNLQFPESTTNVIDVKPYVEKQGVNPMLESTNNNVTENFKNHSQRVKIAMSEPIYTIDCVPYNKQPQNSEKTEASQDITSNNPPINADVNNVENQKNVFKKVQEFLDEDSVNDIELKKDQNGYKNYENGINNCQTIEKAKDQNGHHNLDLDNDFINSCWHEPENGFFEEKSVIDQENHIIEIVAGNNGVEIKKEIQIRDNQVIDVSAEQIIDEITQEVRKDEDNNQVTEEDIKVIQPEYYSEKVDDIGSSGSALATTKGSFSAFLAPLNKEYFKEAVKEVQQKLSTVNETLTMVIHSEGMETVLQEMLSSIALKTGELLAADRTTIFLLDEEKNELWSILAKNDGVGNLEIRIPADKGIAGEVATFLKVVNIPYDFFDDPRSAEAQKTHKKTGYRTYTMLALPLLGEEGDLVAVVQLLNKLKSSNDSEKPLEERIDKKGFT
ncbi:MAG TPA: GAF domain-containing protein, partial [Phormidium sp.]